MTESGQEPPAAGRGSAELSARGLSVKGKASSRRRRRKQRGGQAAGSPQGTGPENGLTPEIRLEMTAKGGSQGQSSGKRQERGQIGTKEPQERQRGSGQGQADHAPSHGVQAGVHGTNGAGAIVAAGAQAPSARSSRKNRKRRGKRANHDAGVNGVVTGGHGQVSDQGRGHAQETGLADGGTSSQSRRKRGRLGAKAALARKGGRRTEASALSGSARLPETSSPAPEISAVAGAGLSEKREDARPGSRRRGRRRRTDPGRTQQQQRANGPLPSAVPSLPVESIAIACATGPSLSGADLRDGETPSGHLQGRSADVSAAGLAKQGGAPAVARGGLSRFSSPLYAALDLGTNNCRLLIARPEERGFRVVDAYSRIVRLGEGVGASKRLGEPAMERAIEALANCHRKLLERGVERSRLIATEACRAAENGDEFIARVKSETGLALEVVNRETEARLAVAGCVSLVDQDAEGVILFDIGGGSSEIVWLDLRNRCGARGFALTRFIRAWTSLPVGVVNLAERHGGVDVTHEVFEAMVADVASHLQTFDLGDELTAAIAGGGVHMLGTSGTVTTLAGVHLGLKRYDRRRVDGAWLESDQVSAMIDHLREMPYDQRVENPCIGADRADLVLAGCAILEAIRRRWSCSRLRVADRGLREGILTELMAADGVWSRRTGPRRPSRQRGRK